MSRVMIMPRTLLSTATRLWTSHSPTAALSFSSAASTHTSRFEIHHRPNVVTSFFPPAITNLAMLRTAPSALRHFPSHRSLTTTAALAAHRPKYVKRPKKNFFYSSGLSHKPRISVMTKGSAEEQVNMYRRLLGEKEEAPAERMEEVFDGAASDEVVTTTASSEAALVEYRDQMVARIVETTENVLNSLQDANVSNEYDAPAIHPSAEMRQRLTRFVGFLLKEGAVYPLDLTRFLTVGPNPRRICFLPEDRLFEVTAALVDVGLRDKALLSVMFHDDLRVFTHPVSRIHESLQFLRKDGVALSETLSTILIDCPGLLADLDQDDWRRRKDWFDHHFTSRSFREFLITQPAVLHEPLEDIEEKFL